MIGLILDSINSLLFLLELYIVSINIFTLRVLTKSKIIKCYLAVGVGVVISVSCISNIVLKNVFQFVWFLILIQLLFVGAIKKKVIFCMFIMIIISLLNEFFYTMLLVIGGYCGVRIGNESKDYIYFCASIIIFLVIWLGNKKIFHRYLKFIELKYLVFFSVLLSVNSFVIMANGYFLIESHRAKRQWMLVNSYFAMVIGMFIQMGLMIALIISRNVYREKEYLAAKYLEEQKLHYEYLENRERQTRKFRHDIKNHLAIINDLMSKQEHEACQSYLQEISEKVDRFSYKISVNNGIADAIVNKFYMEAKQKGIELKVKGHLPNPCHLSAYDLCTILSNLLSNAIEAEHNAGGRFVSAQFRYTDMEIMFAVENDYKQELAQENGAFFTTKADKMNHGFGLENVKECVRKNHGHTTINTQNNIFKVLVCVENGDGEDENCNCR